MESTSIDVSIGSPMATDPSSAPIDDKTTVNSVDTDDVAPMTEQEEQQQPQQDEDVDDEEEEEKKEKEKVKHVRELVRRKRRRVRARLSGPAWEAGVRAAAEWNASVLRDRYVRGPWYWDPHARAAQLFRQWSLARTPATLQLEALVKYLTPLTPDQQSALLATYLVGPQTTGPSSSLTATTSTAAATTTTTMMMMSTSTAAAAAMTPESGRKAGGRGGKRARPRGPHCRMCLKEEEAQEEGESLIRCTECKDQYHLDCLELKRDNMPRMLSFGWRCMHCKKCEICRDTGDEEKLLFCDACDRGFHTFCLSPPLKRPPMGGWFCRECVECKSCGSKTAGQAKSCRWHRGYTMCEKCYKRYKHNKYCPVCSLVYKDKDVRHSSSLRACVSCRRAVHAACDGGFVGAASPYQCPPCRKKGVKPPAKAEVVEDEEEEEEDEVEEGEEGEEGEEEEEDGEEEEQEVVKKKRGKGRRASSKTAASTSGRNSNNKKRKKEESEDEEEEEEEEEKQKTKGKRRKSAGGEQKETKRKEREVSPGRRRG